MKRVLLMIDAAADLPFPELGDQTPLEHAKLPFAGELASEGALGTLKLSRSEADASRSLLAEACGLDSREARELRWGPVAAAALGVAKDPTRMRFLCQFIHIDAHGEQMPVQPSSVEEQDQLVQDVEQAMRSEGESDIQLMSLYPGRFVLDMPKGSMSAPKIRVGYTRNGSDSRLPSRVRKVLQLAEACLLDHSVNSVRKDLSENPLNGIWCWSGGFRVPVGTENVGKQKVLCSSDPLMKGLAHVMGMDFLSVPDPYSLNQPDAGFDVFEVIDALDNHEELLYWIPAPFATDTYEGPEEKVRRLAAVDYYVTGPLLAILREHRPSRMLLLAAGLRHRGRPEKGRVPFALWGEGISAGDSSAWNEVQALNGSLGTPKFRTVLEQFRTPMS